MAFNNKRLEEKLDQAGITKSELDRRLNHKNQAYKYINGILEPGPDLLLRYLVALGMTEDDLKQERLLDWYKPNGQTE